MATHALRRDTDARQQIEEALRNAKKEMVRRRRGSWVVRPLLGAALAFAAGAAIVFGFLSAQTDQQPMVRVKGGGDLQVRLERNGAPRWLQRDDAVRPGDLVRFVAEPRDGTHLLVVRMDAEGAMETLVPAGGDQSLTLQEGRQSVTGALQIGDGTEPERWFAFFSKGAIQSDAVWLWLSSPQTERKPMAQVTTFLTFVVEKQDAGPNG